MTEAYTSWESTIKYYKYGSNVPFNFKFITDANANSTATNFQVLIQKWIQMMPKDQVPNWVVRRVGIKAHIFNEIKGQAFSIVLHSNSGYVFTFVIPHFPKFYREQYTYR